MQPFRIVIGYDEREIIAYHVLCHSILSRSSIPVSITPLRRESLAAAGFTRKRGPLDSTDFATSRFMVPALCGFEGFALFLDCDMLVIDDIAKLYDIALKNSVLKEWAVACVQHSYRPRKKAKFLGQGQTIYPRKNWSSVMLFDCGNEDCKSLVPGDVNRADALSLHRFQWVGEGRIGHLPARWNNLIGEECELPIADSSLLHYTRGGPWFEDEAPTDEPGTLWCDEWRRMNGVKS